MPVGLLSAVIVAALGLTACSSAGSAPANSTSSPAGDKPVASASPAASLTVTAQPVSGATDVSPVAPIGITVSGGSITDLTLTNQAGKQVAGQLSPDKTRFTVTEPLGYGTTYTWTGSTTGSDGRTVPITGSFTTLKPQRTVRAQLNTGDDKTYGIAMPIVITFDTPVKDKAAVQRALSVETSTPAEGGWAWLDDRTVHWRPKQYWTPGTQVTVTAKLYGVAYGSGAYGREDLTSRFTIGRSEIVRGNTQTHRLVVIRDGVQIADYPASYGLDSDPGRVTKSGTHVVMDKEPTSLFNNPKYDYQNVPVQWAVRMSNNGEFIHSAPWSVGDQGKRNVSHGCPNLAPANAKEFFDGVLVGDPVEITGSSQPLNAQDGDYYDWTLTWEQWTAKSAL